MKLGYMVALAAASVLSAQAVEAQTTIASNTGTSNTAVQNFFLGQSFTVAAGTSYNNISYAFQSIIGANTATGNLYLFSTSYGGTPGDLATTTANRIAVATSANQIFTFAPTVTLTGGANGTQYYAYTEARQGMVGYTTDVYAGGSAASASNGAYSNAPTQDFRFTVTGVAVVPEPAVWGLMILGFGIVGGLARRRRVAALA